MAFRKRKKIAKGMHLNLSGSGIGFNYRLFPGLSFSINKNGMYCNTSIPGTGFYSRNKVMETNDNQKDIPSDMASISSNNAPSRGSIIEVAVDVQAKNDGSYTYKLYDLDGNENKSLAIESRIIASRQFKEIVVNAINDCTNELTDIYKLTARPLTAIDMEKKVEEVKPVDITPKTYDIEKPTYESVKKKLMADAKKEIRSLFFWTNKNKREAYVSEMLEPTFMIELSKWESAKNDFDKKQKEFVDNAISEYENAKKTLDGFMNGNEDFINNSINNLLACLKVPFDFSINYEYLPTNNILRIQLDLPEIEDFPKKKATLLATEEMSIKEKGKVEFHRDYATSVCGMAFFFSGMMFNISLNIRAIEISAYTQRINKATGIEEDSYIYSVIFNRGHFARINYGAIDPIEALKAQPNKSKILKSFEMREIVPYTEEEIIDIVNNTEELPTTSATSKVIVSNIIQQKDFNIAGINYRSGIQNYVGSFDGSLIPEPNNKFDPRAIRIVHSDGHHLGYIPSDETDYLRSLVNNNFPVPCRGEITEEIDYDENRKFFQGIVYIEIIKK